MAKMGDSFIVVATGSGEFVLQTLQELVTIDGGHQEILQVRREQVSQEEQAARAKLSAK